MEWLARIFRKRSVADTFFVDQRLEDIREAMLDMLAGTGQQRFPTLARRIDAAVALDQLWYMRSEFMAALAFMHGGTVARERLAAINEMFQDVLPVSMVSRPSPLMG
jgi:hypothetical protein